MKNLKLFLLICTALLLSVPVFSQHDTLTKPQVQYMWSNRVLPSANNISNTWQSVVFVGDTATSGSLYKVKASSTDGNANYLSSKLAAGSGISLAVTGTTNKVVTITNSSPATYPVYYAQVNIDSATFKAANGTTGVIATLVANPGASSFIDVLSVDIQYTYVVPTYNNTTALGVYASTLTPDVSGAASQLSSTILAATAARFNKCSLAATASTTTNCALNSSIVLAFSTPGSKPTIGGGRVTVYIMYRIITPS